MKFGFPQTGEESPFFFKSADKHHGKSNFKMSVICQLILKKIIDFYSTFEKATVVFT